MTVLFKYAYYLYASLKKQWLSSKLFFLLLDTANNRIDTNKLYVVDQPAKPSFRSRYAHIPDSFVYVPYLSISTKIAIFVSDLYYQICFSMKIKHYCVTHDSVFLIGPFIAFKQN